jgi:hypothetical protein
VRRSAGLLAAALALLAPAGGEARAQGVVLGPDGRVLAVVRARALLVFQERALLCYSANEPNRQDLLVELELAAPAPAGARWVLAAPGEAAAARPGDRAAVEEVAAYWTSRTAGQTPSPWPAGEPAALAFAELRREELPAELRAALPERWRAFAATLPEGARRLGPAQLSCQPLVALYPGALGAAPGGEAPGAGWSLAETELMVLHSHFINVDDNTRGLGPALGLGKRFQDEGVLADGRPLWRAPDPRRDPPGAVAGPSGPGLEAAARLLNATGATDSLWLTVVAGRPAAARRGALDAEILSHYPSAVEPHGAGRSLAILGGTVLGVLVLATLLLARRRSFAS